MDSDYEIALALHKELNPDNSSPPKKKVKKSPTKKENGIVGSEWEINDPNPDVHALFQTFDRKYFWGKLECVEVKWSNRMYSCAGTCSYKGKLGGCLITLSLPLLKLRPRKDLVETLLHEMIHAYLFVTDRNREREEHGPKFHEHMHRINKAAGTKITVYHSFHDEVKHYKTHWWQCNGPCKEWKPFFGLVKRSMNRAPGPSDFWFNDHKAKCNGEFIKIKEPDNFKPRKRKQNKTDEKSKGSSSQLTKYFPQTSNSSTKLPKTNANKTSTPSRSNNSGNAFGFSDSSIGKTIASPSNNSKTVGGLLSNKGGTLVLKPKSQSTSTAQNSNNEKEKSVASTNGFVPFSGTGYVLAPPGTVPDRSKSRLLNFGSSSSNPPAHSSISTVVNSQHSQCGSTSESEAVVISDSDSESENISENKILVHCPVCNKEMPEMVINEHLDLCIGTDIFEVDGNSPSSSGTDN